MARYDTSMDKVDHLAVWDYKNANDGRRLEGCLSLPYMVVVDRNNSSLYDRGGISESEQEMERVTTLMDTWLPRKVYLLRDRVTHRALTRMVERATLKITKYRLDPMVKAKEPKKPFKEGDSAAIDGLTGMDEDIVLNNEDSVDSDVENPEDCQQVDE